MKRIRHSQPTISQEDIRVVNQVLTSGKLADSSQVALFEKELSSYIGQKDGVAVNSGTNALFLALLSLGHSDRDEVIIPSYACIALLNAIHSAGLKPRIVDINEHGCNISLREVERAVSATTRAIVAPHMFGDPIADIESMIALGLPVIEDCALSIGAGVNGRKIGGISELSVFSFYATKVMTTGHGGMVLSSSEQMLDNIRDLMRYDNREDYSHSFNFRLTDFQAALGRSQLARLDDFVAKRRSIAAGYDSRLRNIDGIEIPSREKGSIYFRYIIEVEDANRFIQRMSQHNLDCMKPVFKPLHRYLGLNSGDYPNSERAHRHNVSIPIYPALEENEVEHIINTIAHCL